jgi:hypothetical protein
MVRILHRAPPTVNVRAKRRKVVVVTARAGVAPGRGLCQRPGASGARQLYALRIRPLDD